MNKELKKIVKRLNNFKTIKIIYGDNFKMTLQQLEQLRNDVDSVLNYIDNSIPKEEIEKKKRQIEENIDSSQGCMDEQDLYEEYGKLKVCEEILEGK